MSSQEISKFLWNFNQFLDRIFENLKKDNIDISNYELDHICYRVSTIEKYDILKNIISSYWILLAENIISGRNISTFKLDRPIIYKNRKIHLLEIPSPKKGSHYDDWFEHVEFVINCSFDDFMNKYSDINFITKDINKKVNPDIKIKYDNYSVKFHKDSLRKFL